ncbi:hypothetical protein G7Y79_00077g099740 [Physcia stellaris]|nr:hypothetical protein G7Y79_00077g099740 [Physcia stellaris]
MLALPISTLLLLASSAAAKQCMNISVPVDISARTAIFDLPIPQSNSDATAFIQNLTQQGRNFTDLALTGYKNTAGKYQISTQFCVPSVNNVSTPTLQILTHGIGFDKTYWDNPYNNFNYSYVDVATDQYKYCTLSYDRLGIGNSSHGEPLNEIQSYLEVAALAEITMMFRNGTFPGVPKAFKTITHVGRHRPNRLLHELILHALLPSRRQLPPRAPEPALPLRQRLLRHRRHDPQLHRLGPKHLHHVPAAMSIIASYGLTDYVAGLQTRQRVEYADGYLANANADSNQYLFFLPGFFDAQLALAGEMRKQPVAVGELLTLGSVPMVNRFAGPVLVLTGSNDLPYCGGDCLATGIPTLPSIPAAVAANFPNVGAGNFTAYIQPNTGHGLNFHYNQTGAYRVINEFLGGRGLAPRDPSPSPSGWQSR